MRAILVSFFVFLSVCIGTYEMYQYWQTQQSYTKYLIVVPFSNSAKVQSLTLPSGKTLIPSGAIMKANDIDFVTYSYLVNVEEGNELCLVTFSNVTLTKNNLTTQSQNDPLSFSYIIEMMNETQAKVVVTVVLNMPASEAEFNQINGSNISFQVNFIQSSK